MNINKIISHCTGKDKKFDVYIKNIKNENIPAVYVLDEFYSKPITSQKERLKIVAKKFKISEKDVLKEVNEYEKYLKTVYPKKWVE